MENKKGYVTLEERDTLYLMQGRGKSRADIARELGRARSTVTRELRRNESRSPAWRYKTQLERARDAHERAKRRHKERGGRDSCKLDKRPEVCERILALFKETRYSPEKIAEIISLSDLGIKLSGRTIRRWIRRHHRNYQKLFPHRGRRPKSRLTPQKSKKGESTPQKRSIHERPEEANERRRVGDLELDMVVCSQSNNAILSIRDRKLRKGWLRKVSNLKADTVRQAIIAVLRTLPPELRLSCTYDRGSEFADVEVLERFFAVVNYFCDAYSAWQKGGVEYQNRELRQFVPKGTDLSTVSEAEVLRIERVLNAKPRNCLNGLSADDAWFLAVRALQSNRVLH
jgi:IS30 family transposase